MGNLIADFCVSLISEYSVEEIVAGYAKSPKSLRVQGYNIWLKPNVNAERRFSFSVQRTWSVSRSVYYGLYNVLIGRLPDESPLWSDLPISQKGLPPELHGSPGINSAGWYRETFHKFYSDFGTEIHDFTRSTGYYHDDIAKSFLGWLTAMNDIRMPPGAPDNGSLYLSFGGNDHYSIGTEDWESGSSDSSDHHGLSDDIDHGRSRLMRLIGLPPPFSLELIREAQSLRTSTPRSALLIGCAGVEAAAHASLGARARSLRSYVENVPSPPIGKSMRTLYPDIFPEHRSSLNTPEVRRLIKDVEEIFAIRNKVAHGRQMPEHFSIDEAIERLKAVVYLHFILAGATWAVECMPPDIRARMGVPRTRRGKLRIRPMRL